MKAYCYIQKLRPGRSRFDGIFHAGLLALPPLSFLKRSPAFLDSSHDLGSIDMFVRMVRYLFQQTHCPRVSVGIEVERNERRGTVVHRRDLSKRRFA